jgi:hypothetical protein
VNHQYTKLLRFTSTTVVYPNVFLDIKTLQAPPTTSKLTLILVKSNIRIINEEPVFDGVTNVRKSTGVQAKTIWHELRVIELDLLLLFLLLWDIIEYVVVLFVVIMGCV